MQSGVCESFRQTIYLFGVTHYGDEETGKETSSKKTSREGKATCEESSKSDT